MSTTTVYPAAAVYTMDPSLPNGPGTAPWRQATAVAVRDRRIVATGSVDELCASGDHAIDDTFTGKVLLPGFIEAHSHAQAAGFWLHTYCGFFDRSDPSGRTWPGCKNIGEVLERLREADAAIDDPDQPLLAWGLDPIYFGGERLIADHLDKVSTTRRIFVYHASGHIATVNRALMNIEGITADTDMTGVPKDIYGEPIGELQEPPAMELAGRAFRSFHGRMKAEKTKWDLGQLANNAGITTLTDLGNPSSTDPATIDEWRGVVDHPAFPSRLYIFDMTVLSQATIETLIAVRKQSSEKLRLGAIKVVLDGSIQGYTARLRWPGYLNGEQNGMWLHHPEQLTEWMRPFHEAELQVHAHCNGDQAVEVFIETVRELQAEFKRPDHRYVVEHCQLTSPEQYRQMAELGMCANLFSNHIWYWGDQHAASTVGPDRAARMNSARTAIDLGVPISIHTDSPVTPLGPLNVAWAAVNRVTPSGKTLGPDERISVDEALRAITMGAAHLLKMDREVGSLSPGKFADMAILEEDPYKVDPMDLRDIPIWGTMLGGTVFPAASKS